MSGPTIVTVPCFSGAPWDLSQLTALGHRPLRTMRLPDTAADIEAHADFVQAQIADLDDLVLVGDSFGAVVALAVAVRRPAALRGLVLSGGFAANPVDSKLVRAKMAAARFLPGPLYRQLTLRFHAAALASPYDGEGDVPLDAGDFRSLFVTNTPWRSYVHRAKTAFSADYRGLLCRIDVPTLILTPGHDVLIGETAAAVMRHGIPDATEAVLHRTGHMFRFTHPGRYSTAINEFLVERIDPTGRSPRPPVVATA